MAVFHEDFDGIVLTQRGTVKNDVLPIKNHFYLDYGLQLYDYLQKETHETGLLDIVIEPSSAFAGWLFSQHRGNKGIPHTGGGEQTQIND